MKKPASDYLKGRVVTINGTALNTDRKVSAFIKKGCGADGWYIHDNDLIALKGYERVHTYVAVLNP